MSAALVPPDRGQEIIDRLELLERKIDWIARRVAPTPGPQSQEGSQPVATASAVPFSAPAAPTAARGRGSGQQPPAGPTHADRGAQRDPFVPVRPGSPAIVGQPPAAVPTAPARQPLPAPVQAARPSRPGAEGNLGRYLLSGAAALLVILAAVSLIALVWDSIPDVLKVVLLSLVAVVFVGAGTWLSTRRPTQRVAAATMTGTGGALGFVAIIGAVLLDSILPTLAAFALMVLWSLVLLALSRLTAQVFTAVVSTIGALVTVSFASWQAVTEPALALSTWTMVCGYVTALAVVTGVLARDTSAMPLAAWFPTTSMVVTAVALLITPDTALVDASLPMAIVLTLVPSAVLLAQLVHSSRALWTTGARSLTGLDWAVAATVIGTAVPRLLSAIERSVGPESAQGAHLVVGILQLVLVTGPTVALLVSPGPQGWRRRTAPVHVGIVAVLGLVSLAANHLTVPLAVLAVALACAVCVMERVSPALAVLPAFGLLSVIGDADSVPVLLAGTAAALLAVVTTVALESPLESRLASAPEERLGRGALRGSVRTAAWLVATLLAVVVPTLLHRLLPPGESAQALATALGGGVVLVLLLLGLTHPGVSPRRLLTGALVGAAGGDRAPRSGGGPDTSAWLGWALAGLTALTVMVNASLLASLLWRAPLVLLGLGLGSLGARALRPWIRAVSGALATAVPTSVLLWWAVIILSGASLTSVLVTILVLVTGAVCIVAGFRMRVTALRHYGLTLVLVSVLKLAVLDIGSQNSIVRVASLAAGGVVCFALSLAYNKAAAEEQRSAPARDGAPAGPLQTGTAPAAYGRVRAGGPAGTPGQWQPPTSSGGYGLTPPA